MQSGFAVELIAEEQPDHGLDLLIRVDHPLAEGDTDISDRRCAEQLAATGLVQFAQIHPLAPEYVQFRLAS